MEIQFKSKTVIVTGSTRGIGKTIAEKYIENDAFVILTGRSYEEIADLNKKNINKKVKYFQLDLLSEASIDVFIKNILKEYQKIDILVNNAGINIINPISDIRDQDWDDIIRVNLTGTFKLIKFISKNMIQNRTGKIINLASIFGTITREKRGAYTASKAAVIGLTKTASVDLAKYNILVNSVAPGFIATDLTNRILSPDERKDLASRVPLGRLGNTDEVANLVLFLTSDLNTYLTGQNITIDGGFVNI